MSDVVGIVLKMTLGLFVKKARSSLSDKLKDGGLNSQQLRNLIISNLQDVERKLGGLARANLLTSVSRIKEGLRLLGDLHDKPNTPTLPLHEDDDKGEENSTRPSNTGQTSSSESKSPLDVDSALKLVEVMNEWKRNSGEYFTSPMKLFEEANTKATEAFHNEALSVDDRILAAKLRVQSRLLLSLENPSLASQSCRLYLEELHGLAPIVKDFRSYLEGGMASVFNKEKRRELVLSVSAINLVVFKFLKSFTKGPVNLYDWPNITSDDWTYNPLIPDKTVCVGLQNAGFKNPNLYVFKEIGFTDCDLHALAINSDGVLICLNRDPERRRLFKVTVSQVKEVYDAGDTADLDLVGPATDGNDMTYLLFVSNDSPSKTLMPRDLTADLVLIDSNNCSKRKIPLLGAFVEGNVTVNFTPDGFVVVFYEYQPTETKVHFYQGTEISECPNFNEYNKSAYSFKISLWDEFLTTVTNKYQLVASEKFGYHVRVYGKDGQLIREFELYGGKRESCVSIAFNYLTEELVCVSHVGSWFYLSTYELETGVRRRKARLTLFGECSKSDRKYYVYPRLTAHCNGPMVVVSEEYALRLQ